MKRNNQFAVAPEAEEEISFSDWELMRRNHGLKDCDDEHLSMSLSYDFFFNPSRIAPLLAFMVSLQKPRVDELSDCIEARVNNNQHDDEETEKYIQELSDMISADQRLGDLLQHHVIEIFVTLLEHKECPKLQSHVAIILHHLVAYSGKRADVMKLIKPSTIVSLMRSAVWEVQQEALSLLRAIISDVPNCSKSKLVLEEALESLTSLIDSFNESTSYDMLCIASKTLALACQVYLDFSSDELETVLHALMKLLKYEGPEVLAYTCSGIMYLCNQKRKMVVEDEQLGTLVDRLIELIDSESRVKTIAGLVALGSIVRWGDDNDIEVILEKDTLMCLECLLGEDDKSYVKYACWIISNITARKENHIKAVIDSGLIEPLVDVVESYELLDVKREAARAISNAIYGLGLNQIGRLRSSRVKPLGDLLKVLRDDQQFVYGQQTE